MQRGVLKEDILNDTHRYGSIYHFAGIAILAQSLLVSNHNQRTRLGGRQMRTCQDDTINLTLRLLHIARLGPMATDTLHIKTRTYTIEERTDLRLEDNHQRYRTYTDKTLKERARQFQIKYITNQHPRQDKRQYAPKQVAGTRFAQELIPTKQNGGYHENVDDIFDSDVHILWCL